MKSDELSERELLEKKQWLEKQLLEVNGSLLLRKKRQRRK